MVQKDLKGSKRVLLIRSLLVCASQYFGIFKNNFVPKRVQFCVQKSPQSHFNKVYPGLSKGYQGYVLVCPGLFWSVKVIIFWMFKNNLYPERTLFGPQGLGSPVWMVLVCPGLYFEIFNINFVSKEVISCSKRTLRVPKFLLIKSVLV